MSLTPCAWNRFWTPIGTRLHTGDDGFIVDPNSEFGKIANPSLLPFARFRDVPCLALRGEAGIGKSTAIKDLVAASTASCDVRRLDLLRDCGTDVLLFRNLFDAPWFKAWEAGDRELELFLDSLDECAKQFPTVASVLEREFATRPVGRLKLRTVCRSAEWPDTFGDQLQKVWGEGKFRIFELAPLLRQDVLIAAEANDIVDPERFVRQVIERGVQGFASRPIALELLINIFKREGQLRNQLVDLYEQGLPLLCEETPGRREMKISSRLSGTQQVAVASRIAAALVLGSRSAVRTGPDRGDIESWELPLSELTGHSESVNGVQVPVDEAAILETTSSGLFASAGPERRVFAHQTYVEFLVARYLHRGGLSREQIYSVITVADEPHLTIAPRLEEITGWLAGMNPEIFNDILTRQPEVLVRGDVAAVDVEARIKLVDALLARVADEAVPDWYALFSHLRKLVHPGLPDQLRRWIQNCNAGEEVLTAAIDIARACSCSGLSDDLAALALDREQPYEVRVRATAALAHMGTPGARIQLYGLAKGESGDDPQDQLRGYALRALWPDHISATELLSCLRRAQDDRFIGGYRMFLRHDDFAAALQPDGISVGLRWIIEQQVRQDPTDDLRHCAYKIVLRAWNSCDRHDVRTALTAVFWYQLRRHDYDLGFGDREEEAALLERICADGERRRGMIAEMVRTANPSDRVSDLRWTAPALALDEDFEWLLDRALTAQSPEAERWVDLAVATFRINLSNHFEAAHAALARSPLVRKSFAPFFYVELGSQLALWMQEQQKREESRQKREETVLDPPPKERVLQAVNRCLSGNPDCWYQLVLQLTLVATSTHYELCVSARDTPGWREADPATQAHIVQAARRFVHEAIPDESWIGTNQFTDRQLSEFAAFRLLLEEDQAFLRSLGEAVWRRWAASILASPIHDNNAQSADVHRELVALAYEKAPEEILATLDRLITADNAAHGSVFISDRLERCWSDRISDALVQRVARFDLKPQAFGDLLGALLRQGDRNAIALATSLITAPPPVENPQRELSLRATAKLLAHNAAAAWDPLWAAAESDTAWAKAVFEGLAKDLDGGFVRQLNESQVGRLLDWLLAEYPFGSDPKRSGAFMSPGDMVRQWRDVLISRLRDWGTSAATAEIERLKGSHPDLPWLQRVKVKAERARHGSAWTPIPPQRLFELAQNRDKRFVASGKQLLDVLCESLRRLQEKLQGQQPRARYLWDTVVCRPKEEEDLSDYIKAHFEDDLVKPRIIAGREPKIRRRNWSEGQPGQLVDIQVNAISTDPRSGSTEIIRAIIEVKGCWNRDLKTAMKTQLLERYLAENQCDHGLYVVGWFLCPYWDDGDPRKAQARRHFPSIESCREFLDAQPRDLSKLLPSRSGKIRGLVLDFTLR
ncbi:MAG: hypothetical protein ABSA52_19370 [Candidatus Binatia bacterium]|jgi:hypothetical protein